MGDKLTWDSEPTGSFSIHEVPIIFLVSGGLVSLMMMAIRQYCETVPGNVGAIFAIVIGVVMSAIVARRAGPIRN
jgi:hypothetical protein